MLSNRPENMFVAIGESREHLTQGLNPDDMRESLHVFEGEASDEYDKLKLVSPLLGLYAQHLLFQASEPQSHGAAEDEGGVRAAATAKGRRAQVLASQSTGYAQTHAIFESMLLDTKRPLFPTTIIVKKTMRAGKQVEVRKPKRQQLFGDLQKRTRQLVADLRRKEEAEAEAAAHEEHPPAGQGAAAASSITVRCDAHRRSVRHSVRRLNTADADWTGAMTRLQSMRRITAMRPDSLGGFAAGSQAASASREQRDPTSGAAADDVVAFDSPPQSPKASACEGG